MKQFTAKFDKNVYGYFLIHAKTKKEAQEYMDNFDFEHIEEFEDKSDYSTIEQVEED